MPSVSFKKNPLQQYQVDQSTGYSIQDFSPNVDEVAPVNNRASSTNVAAYSTLLAGNNDDPVGTYHTIVGEMQDTGKSYTANNLLDSARATEQGKITGVMPSVLADKNVPDATKYQMVQDAYDKNSAIYHPANMFASSAIAAPVPQESQESQDVRYSSAALVNAVNDTKRAQQNLLNGEMAKNDPSTVNKVLDIVQTMVPGANQYMTAKARSEATGDTLWSYAKSFIAPGSAKEDMQQMLLKTDPSQRVQMTQKLIDVVNNTAGIVMSRPNDFQRVQELQQIVGQDGIDNVAKWTENFSAVADLAMGLGTVAKVGKLAQGVNDVTKGLKSAEDLGDISKLKGAPVEVKPSSFYESAIPSTIETKVQPATVSQVAKDTNPDIFRGLHEAAASDETGRAAEALYGTTRDDAVVNDLGPQIDRGAPVTAKVNVADATLLKSFTPDQDLANFVGNDGAIYYKDAQKVANQSRITNDFQQAFGVTARKEMFQIRSDAESTLSGNKVNVKAVYGPQESGFNSPREAMDAVKFALRDYGVDDSSLTLLKREGGDYVPANINDVASGVDPGFSSINKESDIKDLYDTGHYAQTNTPKGPIRLQGIDHGGDAREVIAYDQNGKQVGNVIYGQGGDRIDNPNVKVDPDWQKNGVANAMYDYAEAHGAKFPSPEDQKFSRSAAGQSFRDARANPARQKFEFTGNDKGDYLVQVNHQYKMNPFSMTDWPENKVNNNWFMRSGVFQGSSGAGSLQRHLVNITSMLEPHLTLGMSKAVTKSAGVTREFVRIANDTAESFGKLSKDEKGVVMDMIKEGNVKGKWWSPNEMYAAGLNDDQTKTLESWKNYWDNHYHFENIDHTQSLANRGYMKYEHGASDTNLWARPIKSVNGVPRSVRVYDPLTDTLKTLKDSEVVDHYNNGGLIAELEHVELHGGQEFQHLLSSEKGTDGYLRAFNENDKTLNYRPGYYHVGYKDDHFIEKIIKNGQGKEVDRRAVATAATRKDAEDMVSRLHSMDGGDYNIRGSNKAPDGRQRDLSSVQRAKGRSAQRFRGQRLEDATSIISDPSHSHIESPMDAMVNSAKSISRRLALRDPIDAMKQGLMKQYEQFMPHEQGQARFPNNINDITNPSRNSRLDKEVNAAKSTYEYIQQMEYGYVNHIDDSYKALMNVIGNKLGEVSVDTRGLMSKAAQVGEKGVRAAGKAKPTSILRSGANMLFIATNPIRQLFVQGHQAMQLIPVNPKFFANYQNATKVGFLIAKQLGQETSELWSKALGMSKADAETMWQHYRTSGNMAAVDTHTMINGNIKNFVDGLTPTQTITGKVGQTITRPLGVIRKVGFDAGENFNQTAAWAAYRDLAVRSGKDMNDPAVRDMVAAQATNFTGNMNQAGQNAYEANSLNTGLQFMGWAHRWGGIMTGNRAVDAGTKGRLWAWQLLAYGMPGGYAGYEALQKVLPSDPNVRDNVTQGLAGMFYNKIASMIGGDDVKADWTKNLSPFDMYGTAAHLKAVMTGDIGALFADSAAGSLFFGQNAPLTNLVKDATKWTNLSEDSKDHPVTLSAMANDFIKMFPGLSNPFKAAYAYKTGQKLSSYTGKVVDSNISNTQALLQLAGIGSIDEAKSTYVNSVMNQKYKELQQDVQHFHDERKRLMLNEDVTPEQFNYYLNMTSEFFRAYPHNSQAQFMYKKLIDQDIQSGDTRILKQLMQMHNLMTKNDADNLASMYPDKDAEQMKQYKQLVEFLYNGEDPTADPTQEK